MGDPRPRKPSTLAKHYQAWEIRDGVNLQPIAKHYQAWEIRDWHALAIPQNTTPSSTLAIASIFIKKRQVLKCYQAWEIGLTNCTTPRE